MRDIKARTYRAPFTLIELLVVVAIIAILFSILAPNFSRVREKARRAVCMSNLRQWGTGAMNFAKDFNSYIPRRKGNMTNIKTNPGELNGRNNHINDTQSWRKYGTPIGTWVKYGLTQEVMLCPSGPTYTFWTEHATYKKLRYTNSAFWGTRIMTQYAWVGGLDQDIGGGQIEAWGDKNSPANRLTDDSNFIMGSCKVLQFSASHGSYINHKKPGANIPDWQGILRLDNSVRDAPAYTRLPMSDFSFVRGGSVHHYSWEGTK